jgi:hypothetical protein
MRVPFSVKKRSSFQILHSVRAPLGDAQKTSFQNLLSRLPSSQSILCPKKRLTKCLILPMKSSMTGLRSRDIGGTPRRSKSVGEEKDLLLGKPSAIWAPVDVHIRRPGYNLFRQVLPSMDEAGCRGGTQDGELRRDHREPAPEVPGGRNTLVGAADRFV